MAELSFSGQSIECHSADVLFKNIIPSNIINNEKLGDCCKYHCDRDGMAIISKEFNPKPTTQQEKEKRLIKISSNLNKGDYLSAATVFLLVQGYKIETPKKIKKKKKLSHSHTGQIISVKSSHVYGEIVHPFVHIQNALEKRNEEKKKIK